MILAMFNSTCGRASRLLLVSVLSQTLSRIHALVSLLTISQMMVECDILGAPFLFGWICHLGEVKPVCSVVIAGASWRGAIIAPGVARTRRSAARDMSRAVP